MTFPIHSPTAFHGPVDRAIVIKEQNGPIHVGSGGSVRPVRDLPKASAGELSPERREFIRVASRQLLAQDAGAKIGLTGPPGIGKTAIAAGIAQRKDIRKRFPNVLTAGIAPNGNVYGEILRWCTLLSPRCDSNALPPPISGPQPDVGSDIGRVKERVVGELTLRGSTLVIIDNAWHRSHIEALELTGAPCAYIVTTQHIGSVENMFSKAVPALSESASRELLSSYAPDIVRDEPRRITELVHRLGGLPLALILVGERLRSLKQETGARISNVLDEMLAAAVDVRDFDCGEDVACRPRERRSLSAALGMSFDAALPPAKNAILTASLFPPLPSTFSEDALRQVTNAPDEVLASIVGSSLLDRMPFKRYASHVIVNRYIAHIAKKEESASLMLDAVRRFVSHYYELIKESQHRGAIRPEQANILRALELCAHHRLPILYQFIRHMEPLLFKTGIDGVEKIAGIVGAVTDTADPATLLGGDHSDLCWALLVRAELLEKLGRYKDAEKTLERVTALPRERIDACQHIKVLELLAVLNYNRANYQDAQRMLLEAAGCIERIPRRQRARFCGIYRRLGEVALNTGDFRLAEDQFSKGLELVKPGKNAEELSGMYLGLGVAAFAQAKHAVAEEVLKDGQDLAEDAGHSERVIAILHMRAANALRVADNEPPGEERSRLFGASKTFLVQGLRLARSNGRNWYVSALRNECGELHRRLATPRHRSAARVALRRAFHIAKVINSPDRKAFALFSWALLEREDGRMSSAIEKAKACRNLFVKIRHYMAEQAKALVKELDQPLRIGSYRLVRPSPGRAGSPYSPGR